ncbi:hypothetical protein SDC9_100607 [bioreactor metagenome]|uniref:Uncharacterized protein n=1 Tax=bioreactor metagenome TaxID=1076179 RepID=A0A645ALC4_9ZZZZ
MYLSKLAAVGEIALSTAATDRESSDETDSCVVPESFTVTVTEYEPGIAGVPLITPVSLAIESPFGSPVALHVYGVVPPAAESAKL